MSTQDSKPVAPGRKPTKFRERKPKADIMKGVDDAVDNFPASPMLFNACINQSDDSDDADDHKQPSEEPAHEDFDIKEDDDFSDDELAFQQNKGHQAKKSVEHFKIKSVSVFGEALFGLAELCDEVSNEWKEQRKMIETELIETEKRYCSDLEFMNKHIIEAIFAGKMLDEKYRKAITSNLPQICNFHNDFFLPRLIEEQKNGNIIKVFDMIAPFFKMYIEFIKDYQKILDIFAVHGNESKNKKLHKFLKQKRKEAKPLSNLLISPIQRIPRYLLLLQDMKSKTPETYKDYQHIENAIQQMDDITNYINEKQREIDNMSQCLQIQEKVRGLEMNLVEPARKYLAQFTFLFKHHKRLKLHHFCVFSDILIITNDKWKCKHLIELRVLEAKLLPKMLDDEKHGPGFELRFNQILKLYFDTNESMEDTVDEFLKLAAAYKNQLIDNDTSFSHGGWNALETNANQVKHEKTSLPEGGRGRCGGINDDQKQL